MRSEDRAKKIVGGANVGDPIAHGFIDGILERAAAGIDAHDLCAKHAHTGDVERLARHVFRTHVDNAFEARCAATVAQATPCWPAPVSAMMRGLPIFRA